MRAKPLKVVSLADMHVGSDYALADPKVTGDRPGRAVRSALYGIWREASGGPWHRPDVLIVAGDCVEGQNRKSGGIGTWTTDLLEQADHAAKLLRMWDAKSIYMVRGSNYHVAAAGSGLQVEEYIARKIGAVEFPNQDGIEPEDRDRSGWEWYLDLGGVVFHVSHKIAVSKVFHYQSTPTARQMLQARLNDRLRHELTEYGGERRSIQVVLRAHAHYYNTVGFSGSEGYVLPCWKGLDEFMLSNGPLDISPDIGFLGFTIENGGYSREKNLWTLGDIQPPPLSVVGRRVGENRPGRRVGRGK